MQTALAVRDVLFTLIEIAPGIGVYFIAIIALAGGFALKLMLPFLAWIVIVPGCAYSASCRGESRAGTGPCALLDDRTDLRRLHQHHHREAVLPIPTVEAHFARAAMEDFSETGFRQMRLVSQFEIVNQALVVGLIMAAGGYALWLWHQGDVGAGAVAAITAMALRINGMSHWIMWQMTSLFESIGTLQDGMATLTRGPQGAGCAGRRGAGDHWRSGHLRQGELQSTTVNARCSMA